MIRIQQLKLPVGHTKEQLLQKIAKMMRRKPEDILEYHIRKQSIDARKKQQISFVYTVDVKIEHEPGILKHLKSSQISKVEEVTYQFPVTAKGQPLKHSPVVVGSGPAGLRISAGGARISASDIGTWKMHRGTYPGGRAVLER